jgi:Ca-activated chloride channel family protein
MPPKIHLERMMHRNSIAARGESVASYALLKLIPAGDGDAPVLPLNVVLVVDVSGSMYEEDGTGVSRLRRVQNAALRALDRLRPGDSLAIVAFAHTAETVLPLTSLAEKAKIADVIERIDRFEVDPGGTNIPQGLQTALGLLPAEKHGSSLSRIVVLTDGETTGERECRELVQGLPDRGVSLAVMGVGTEWNASLLKDMAKLGGGRWYYIDVDKAEETERIILEEFGHLTATLFTDVRIHFRPVKDVKVKRCRLVQPEIRELVLQEVGERHLEAHLGTLERDKPVRAVVDLSLPVRPDGNYVVAQVEVTYAVAGEPAATGNLPLQIAYSAVNPSYINAEVAKHIDEVQIFELNNNLQQAISLQNQPEVQRLAETIERKAEQMGPRGAKKTMLARQALAELSSSGKVTRKTQLALEDCARLAEEMPALTS